MHKCYGRPLCFLLPRSGTAFVLFEANDKINLGQIIQLDQVSYYKAGLLKGSNFLHTPMQWCWMAAR